MWNPRGGELFFQSADREMMSVRVGSGESPEPTTPRRLFVYDAEMYGGIQENYATHSITSDGNRFLMLRRSSIRDRQRTIAVLENFLGR